MKKILLVISVVLVAVLSVVLINLPTGKNNMSDEIYGPSVENGFISEKIIGNPDTAKIVIFEYADYGCSHCAHWNSKLNTYREEYGDKIAIVFRSYSIGYENGDTAQRAATAAHLQGYWKEYKDLLFSNQGEWFSANSETANILFLDYFRTASNDRGDIIKFQKDMSSESVRKRHEFDRQLGKSFGINATPTFRINGETIKNGDMSSKIEEMVK